jgi:hypothetical protein
LEAIVFTKTAFVVGAGLGYVLGARAGREQFDKLVQYGKNLENSRAAQTIRSKAPEGVQDAWDEAKNALSDGGGNGAHAGSSPQSAERPIHPSARQ